MHWGLIHSKMDGWMAENEAFHIVYLRGEEGASFPLGSAYKGVYLYGDNRESLSRTGYSFPCSRPFVWK